MLHCEKSLVEARLGSLWTAATSGATSALHCWGTYLLRDELDDLQRDASVVVVLDEGQQREAKHFEDHAHVRPMRSLRTQAMCSNYVTHSRHRALVVHGSER